MAYTHSKYEVQMSPVRVSGALATTLDVPDLGTTGIQAKWSPGYVPHIIRGAAIVPLSTGTLANAIHTGFMADISTVGTATEMFKIVIPTGSAMSGKSYYYTPTYQIEVKPGRQTHMRVTAAEGGVRAHVVLYVEPRWEEAGNITGMQQTT